jgi:uncharacterized protein YndB with AHSA1/START domain
MREIHDHVEATIGADPAALFATITQIDRLPEWNRAIETVIDRPTVLAPGAEWTVQMHPARAMRWKSVSTLQEFDPKRRRFAYRTVNADGNPSYALWEWALTPTSSGVRVAVRWDVYLKTLDRRLLGGPIRKGQLRKEVAASLRALAEGARPIPPMAGSTQSTVGARGIRAGSPVNCRSRGPAWR